MGCPNTTLLAPLPYPPYLYISFYFYIWNCNNVAIVQEVELEMAVAFLFPCLLLTQWPHALHTLTWGTAEATARKLT